MQCHCLLSAVSAAQTFRGVVAQGGHRRYRNLLPQEFQFIARGLLLAQGPIATLATGQPLQKGNPCKRAILAKGQSLQKGNEHGDGRNPPELRPGIDVLPLWCPQEARPSVGGAAELYYEKMVWDEVFDLEEDANTAQKKQEIFDPSTDAFEVPPGDDEQGKKGYFPLTVTPTGSSFPIHQVPRRSRRKEEIKLDPSSRTE